MEGFPLGEKIPRLFDLATNRWMTVEEMWRRGWEEGGGAWEWRRRLFAWEECVRECSTLLHNIVLQDNIVDKWRWLLDLINGYSVSGTYHFLTMAESPFDRGLSADV